VIVAAPLFFNMAGCGLAQWLPIWLMDDSTNFSEISTRYDTIGLLGLGATVPALLFYIPWFIHPLKPNTTQETTDPLYQEKKNLGQKVNWFSGTWLQMKTLTPCLNLIMGASAFGFWSTFLTIINQTMVDFGYTDEFTGLMGFLVIVVATVLSTIAVDTLKTPKLMDLGAKLVSFAIVVCWVIFLLLTQIYRKNVFMSESLLFTGALGFYYFFMGTCY
jgi:hypothetical protein